ncbi:hypothetical protein LTR66_016746, partial [Elasticomyces elasticus]
MARLTRSFVASSLFTLLALSSVASAEYWMGEYNHVGKVAFQTDANYKAFRNVVKDYNCDNTGQTDATACITKAIQDPGDRCGGGDASSGSYCQSSTITPALVYFPPGIYKVTSELVM